MVPLSGFVDRPIMLALPILGFKGGNTGAATSSPRQPVRFSWHGSAKSPIRLGTGHTGQGTGLYRFLYPYVLSMRVWDSFTFWGTLLSSTSWAWYSYSTTLS